MAEEDIESVKLGEKIQLSGFNDSDSGEKKIIRKVVGNYLNKFEKLDENVSSLKIRLKKVHETEKNALFQINVLLTTDEDYTSEETERNLFFALDKALKNIETQLKAKKD